MAMEDAVCLSHMVAAHPGCIDEALAAYCSRRVLRTTRVQLLSRQMGEHVCHPAGAHARLRNAVMRAKTQEGWYDVLQWLYGGSGLDERNFG
jgi:salicylate hydroxylase